MRHQCLPVEANVWDYTPVDYICPVSQESKTLFPKRLGFSGDGVDHERAAWFQAARLLDARLEAGFLSQDLGFVGAFPGRFDVVAAKVTVGRRRPVDGTAQIQLVDDVGRSEVKVFLD